jgi:hypothetical protein
LIIICGFLCAFAAAAAAQEPNSRIDLDVMSNSPIPPIVVARISFAESGSECPDDQPRRRSRILPQASVA